MFESLQGTLGRYYALDSGEPEPVADAIREHYLPKSAGDASPQSKIAFAVGLADEIVALRGGHVAMAGSAPSLSRDELLAAVSV